MQTFDALLPASHTASPRNAETTINSGKPGHPGEKFGDVMERALTGTARESKGDDSDTQATEKSGAHDTATSSSANQTKHTAKSPKPLRRDSAKDDTTAANATDAGTPHIAQLLHQTGSEDEGTSHDASKIGTEKGTSISAVGNADDTSKLIAAQLLALSGVPQPVSSPSASAPEPAGARVSKDAKGTSGPVTEVTAKTGAPGVSSTLPEISEPHEKPAQPNSDPKDAATKKSDAGAETLSARNSTTAPPAPGADSKEAHSDKPDPVDAVAPAPDTQNAQATTPKASSDSISASPVDLHGTSAAKQHMTMKKAEKIEKVAGPAEQDLPGDAAAGSEELPTGQELSAKASLQGSEKLEPTASADSHAATRISTSAEPITPNVTAAAVPPTAGADSRLRVLERTHDIVALHAMRLSQTGSDSLHVVVKPGAGIQLSLELRQSEGGIEVRASLHKGDFEHLSQYWPELQQRLESRGVRVGTLTTSENFSSTGQQQFQQSKQQSSSQDPLFAGAFAEFALAGSMSEAPAARAARATAYRGWETWA